MAADGKKRKRLSNARVRAQKFRRNDFPNRLQSLAADGKKRKRLSNALVRAQKVLKE